MNIDLNKIGSNRPVNAPAELSPASMGVPASELKPILDGGLKVSIAERNVLDDIQKVENAEEPSRNDPLGRAVKDAFNFEPPQMPNFV